MSRQPCTRPCRLRATCCPPRCRHATGGKRLSALHAPWRPAASDAHTPNLHRDTAMPSILRAKTSSRQVAFNAPSPRPLSLPAHCPTKIGGPCTPLNEGAAPHSTAGRAPATACTGTSRPRASSKLPQDSKDKYHGTLGQKVHMVPVMYSFFQYLELPWAAKHPCGLNAAICY